MQSDDPPFLDVGTEVSAKFKGAFCEAKIKRITKSVRCKVLLKTPPFGTIFADHTEITGPLELNERVEVTQGKMMCKGIIQNIKDNSVYIVVFNDGDERQLRRTQIRIKGGKHYEEGVSLDSMPLWKPETFTDPVVLEHRKRKQKSGEGEFERVALRSSCLSILSTIFKSRQQWERFKRKQQQQQPVTTTSSDAATVAVDDDYDYDDDKDDQEYKYDDDDDVDDVTSNDDSTLENTSTMLSVSSNCTVDRLKTSTSSLYSSRTLRNRPVTNKSTRQRTRIVYTVCSTHRPNDFDQQDTDIGSDTGDNNDGDDDSSSEDALNLQHFKQSSKPTNSRMNADHVYKKSVARTREKRYAAEVATDALKRINDSSSSDDKCGLGDDGIDNNNKEDESDEIFDDGCYGDINCGGGGYNNDNEGGGAHKIRGRTYARKKHCSTDDDNDDDDNDDRCYASYEGMDVESGSNTGRRGERRRRLDEEESGPSKKRSKHFDDIKKIHKVGSVVAVYEDTLRKGKWTPAVVVAKAAFKSGAKSAVSMGKKDVLLKSFKDGKYFISSMNKLSSFNASALKLPDPSSKVALERAVAFAEKEIYPSGWDRMQIYDDIRSGKSEISSSSNEIGKHSKPSGKMKRKKAKGSDRSSSSEEESSSDEEYGEERDQFIAQLYKFHEERGTPINRAPILGGKDIDMFRLYNVVQRFGGKKRVTENNQWKLVLRKMHLEGCPGATSVTVKNAYSRYLDHFNSFFRNLGISSWLTTPTSSISSRSGRPSRLLDRHNAQRKWSLSVTKKKEKEVSKGKASKREKEDSLYRGRKGKAKKVGSVRKYDMSEDDDKVKTTLYSSSNSSTSLPSSPPVSKMRSKTNNGDSQDKESLSDSATIESAKEKESYKINKSEKKGFEERRKKRNSPSTLSTSSNVDHGLSRSDDEELYEKECLKETRKYSEGGSCPVNQKELVTVRGEKSSLAKDSDYPHVSKKEKSREAIVTWVSCCSATVLTSFYMGQNVKAYHCGQWYDARVITLGKVFHNDVLLSMMDFEARCKAISESTDFEENDRKGALASASERLNGRLERIMRDMTCCVHYLGWNSRYDEWVELIKIKVHKKDQNVSENQFISMASGKLSKATIEAAVAWRSAVDPVKYLANEASSSGLRPRRLSHSHEHATQSEARSKSTTFSEKKVKKQKFLSTASAEPAIIKIPDSSVISSASYYDSCNLVESNAEISLSRSPEEASVSEVPLKFSLVRETVSIRILLGNKPEVGSEAQMTVLEVKSSGESRGAVSDSGLIAETMSSETSLNVKATVLETEMSDNAGPSYASPVSEMSGSKKVDYEEVTGFEIECRASAVETVHSVDVPCSSKMVTFETFEAEKRKKHQDESVDSLTKLSDKDEINLEPDMNNERKEIITTQSSMEDSGKVDDKSVLLRPEAPSKECDKEAWQLPMPSGIRQRGRGMKKRKAGRGTYGMARGAGKGSKKGNSEEQSKGSEECSSSEDECLLNVRDSWHALKQRMSQKVDSEGLMAYAERELNLEPIDDNLPGDVLIAKHQERMQQLRDIYHNIRLEQARLDRRWKKTLEKRKQREKERKKKDEHSVQSPPDDVQNY
ncbi:unnamed protein product [Thelazia callipaeda]|uniref:ARID domain-containing protein n=1 Tax=Thelazia callipaeda TaxID=103827 RepID=A0A0N5D4P2_THECL|nr:unnamed protein product [Thelazia callipaeda]